MEPKASFTFEKTKLLPYVKFKRIAFLPAFSILRMSLALLSAVLIFVYLGHFLPTNSSQFFSFKILNPFFVLAYFYLVFELYLLRLGSKKPTSTVSNVQGNVADTMDFEALERILLSLQNKDEILASVFLKKIASSPLGRFVFQKANLDFGKIVTAENQNGIYNLTQLVLNSYENAKNEGKDYTTCSDLLLGAFIQDKVLKKAIFDAEIEFCDLQNIVFWYDANSFERKSFGQNLFVGAGIGEDWSAGYTLATEKFGSDITSALNKKRLNPFIVGREREILQIEKILSKSERSNVILVGPAGVGKTSIVYGLAKKSSAGGTLPNLRYLRVLYLDIGALIAGTQNRGEIEERFKRVMSEIQSAGNVILYIDEIQNLAGAQVADRPIDLTGLAVEALSSSRIHVISSVTTANFRRYIETRPTFLELFEKMDVIELSKNETIRALEKISLHLEKQFKITITYKAIVEAVNLSNTYIQGKVLPGKAIDLLEESCTNAATAGKRVLEKDEIEKSITAKTGIPVGRAKKEEGKVLLGLEDVLHKRVVGQEEAIKAVADALRRARVMVREKERPIGTFLFLGPTGVGKTQTAKTIASTYFGSETSMVRLDMSEFSQGDSIDLLIGSKNGNQAGQLTEAVKRKPYTLILLDELEKANRDVLNLFLQVFDDGRIVDVDGAVVKFSETIIIATSNAGSELIRERIQKNVLIPQLKTELLEYLQREKIFSPEFLNRFDEVVVFKPLTLLEIVKVAQIELSELEIRLEAKDIGFEITPRALDFVAKAGYNPVYGARPLKRVIQDSLEAQIAKLILSESLKRGQRVSVDVSQNKSLSFSVKID